jgi:hypothetical protein
VGIDRYAAAIVGDGQAIARFQNDLDPARMASDRFVHAVVEHFGCQMVQRAFVGPADIHSGAAADGLQPFEYLDMGGVIVGRCGGSCFEKVIGHGQAIGPAP